MSRSKLSCYTSAPSWLSVSGGCVLILALLLAGCGKSSGPNDLGSSTAAGPTLAHAKWTKHLVEAGVKLQSVAWSGREYVAVGDQGVIFRSENLQQWTRTAPDTKTYYTTVGWLGAKFFVGGHDGTILTSSNGNYWHAANVSSKGIVYGFAAKGSLIVAVCSGGDILTSADGEHWTLAANIRQVHPASVAWSGQQFVAVGIAEIGDRNFRVMGGAILTSSDGVGWTTKTDAGTLFDVVWTGTEFAAINGDGFLLLSPDGIEWDRRALPVPAATSIAWTGTEYALVADGVVLTGMNPLDWTKHRLGIPMENRVRATWTGEKLLITGGDSIFEAIP